MDISAKSQNVVFVLYDQVTLFDVSGPAEVFIGANQALTKDAYSLSFTSAGQGARIRTSSGLDLFATEECEVPNSPDLLVIPGALEMPLLRALETSALLDHLDMLAARSKRIATICSGAFFAGALGLADKRRVTTHMSGVDEFAKRFPKALLQRDALYVEDGNLWSSAGVASGVDMALSIVSRDHGAQVALEVAKEMVLFLFRDGRQSQQSAPMDFQVRAAQSDLIALIASIEDRLHEELTVERLADMVGLSVRTLHRRCRSAFDMSPAKLLSELRLERARSLLVHDTVSIKGISARCGFADAATFSKAFTHRFGKSPTVYRIENEASQE